MDISSLFRKEVLEPKHAFGPLLIQHTLQKEQLIFLVFTIFVLISLWLFLGTYTEKVRVKGLIDTSPQHVALYPSGKSMVVKQYVTTGQQVVAGTRLLRLQPVDDGTQDTKKKLAKNFPLLEQKLMAQIHQKKAMLHAISPLVEKHYISEKEQTALSGALFQDEKQLADLSMQKMQLNRQRVYEVFAPISGQINEMEASVGQWVLGDKPLLKISPVQFDWVGLLFVPVQFSRFIQAGNRVDVHYAAYPHRRYGSVLGVMQLFSPLLVHQASRALPVPMAEPFYAVPISLARPYLHYQKRALPLYQGMTFEAVLYGEKKPLWKRLKEQYAHGFS